MNDLRRQNSRPQQTFERWTPRTHESPSELARQSEAKRKQAPQSEANVCRPRRREDEYNRQKTSLINCTGHPMMYKHNLALLMLVCSFPLFLLLLYSCIIFSHLFFLDFALTVVQPFLLLSYLMIIFYVPNKLCVLRVKLPMSVL